MYSEECPEIMVSIIMAVYNAEAYIHRCIDSLIAQTLRNFELIIVDDGSTDQSLAICNEYANNDCRIKVLHKENGGVSDARQLGVEHIIGKYSIHVDPDDWVEPMMLESLYRKAEETRAEMVICDYWVDYFDHSVRHKQNPGSTKPLNVLHSLFQGLHGSLCNKLILSTCYRDFHIKFPKDINYCEDLIVNIMMLQHMKKVSYLPIAFYHYDQFSNKNSLTRGSAMRLGQQTIQMLKIIRELLEEDNKNKPYWRFEILHGLHILESGVMEDDEFRFFFKQGPLKLLLEADSYRYNTFLVIAVSRLYISQDFCRRFIFLRKKLAKLRNQLLTFITTPRL